MIDINPITWFGTRELEHIPPHFVKSSTSVDEEKYMWILSKLSGRFCIDENHSLLTSDKFFILSKDFERPVYFEDPKEAMIFELRWSGS